MTDTHNRTDTDNQARSAADQPPGTLWDVTAIQAVRLLGELVQEGEGMNEEQVEQLCASMDQTPDMIAQLLDRVSDMWDDIKSHSGVHAPAGEMNPAQMVTFMHERMQEELT